MQRGAADSKPFADRMEEASLSSRCTKPQDEDWLLRIQYSGRQIVSAQYVEGGEGSGALVEEDGK